MGVLRRRRRSTVERLSRQHRNTVVAVVSAICVVGLVFIRIMGIYPPAFGVALVLLLVLVAVTVANPALGLGVAIVLGLIGDARAMPWWPMVKSMSSRESILFIADGVTISPFEIVLGLVLATWLIARRWDPDAPPLVAGRLAGPLLLFTAMVPFGFAWGMSRGGSLEVAVFEARPLLYIAPVYFAASNLFTDVRHYHRLLWGITIALTIEAVHTLSPLGTPPTETGTDTLSPVEHTAALHMNVVFLFLIGSAWLGRTAPGRKIALLGASVPIVWLYLIAERRAGVVALVIGGIVLVTITFGRDRKRTMRVLPLLALLVTAYAGAFWNAEESQIGFPAQAIKIIVQPDSATEKDASSNIYRDLENRNLLETVQANPVTGIGFGQKFLRPFRLPNITGFVFWEYIPHNSILWIWTKVGVVGFVAFLYTFALATALGLRAARRIPSPRDAAVVTAFAAYVPMTLVFARVDITFDVQTTILLGASFAAVASTERITGIPIAASDSPSRRVPVGNPSQKPSTPTTVRS